MRLCPQTLRKHEAEASASSSGLAAPGTPYVRRSPSAHASDIGEGFAVRSELGDLSGKKSVASHGASAMFGIPNLETFERDFPDDPLLAKWRWQSAKMDLVRALCGTKLGRQRETASGYAVEAENHGRADEAAKLREKMKICEKAEKLGLGAWMTMPRTELDEVVSELERYQVDYPTNAKTKLLQRALMQSKAHIPQTLPKQPKRFAKKLLHVLIVFGFCVLLCIAKLSTCACWCQFGGRSLLGK